EYIDAMNDIRPSTDSDNNAFINQRSKLLLHNKMQLINTNNMTESNFNDKVSMLFDYAIECAIHTEEVIIKGPIESKKIGVYQSFPLKKVYKPKSRFLSFLR
ncbi:MAG: hypothetical protein PUP46_02405, partial [Endozoicomonas sp. (ex Botrylloides leachii)]|nr:hypothetical protein [Endozoicomonas sp. (ex Botrylloides leachii)]